MRCVHEFQWRGRGTQCIRYTNRPGDLCDFHLESAAAALRPSDVRPAKPLFTQEDVRQINHASDILVSKGVMGVSFLREIADRIEGSLR